MQVGSHAAPQLAPLPQTWGYGTGRGYATTTKAALVRFTPRAAGAPCTQKGQCGSHVCLNGRCCRGNVDPAS